MRIENDCCAFALVVVPGLPGTLGVIDDEDVPEVPPPHADKDINPIRAIGVKNAEVRRVMSLECHWRLRNLSGKKVCPISL
jgi:hypothetical protein